MWGGSTAEVEWMEERETGDGAKGKKEKEPDWVELKAVIKELSFPLSPVGSHGVTIQKGRNLTYVLKSSLCQFFVECMLCEEHARKHQERQSAQVGGSYPEMSEKHPWLTTGWQQ